MLSQPAGEMLTSNALRDLFLQTAISVCNYTECKTTVPTLGFSVLHYLKIPIKFGRR